MIMHAITFYRYKMLSSFRKYGHYDIFVLKQNNLFIFKNSK